MNPRAHLIDRKHSRGVKLIEHNGRNTARDDILGRKSDSQHRECRIGLTPLGQRLTQLACAVDLGAAQWDNQFDTLRVHRGIISAPGPASEEEGFEPDSEHLSNQELTDSESIASPTDPPKAP